MIAELGAVKTAAISEGERLAASMTEGTEEDMLPAMQIGFPMPFYLTQKHDGLPLALKEDDCAPLEGYVWFQGQSIPIGFAVDPPQGEAQLADDNLDWVQAIDGIVQPGLALKESSTQSFPKPHYLLADGHFYPMAYSDDGTPHEGFVRHPNEPDMLIAVGLQAADASGKDIPGEVISMDGKQTSGVPVHASAGWSTHYTGGLLEPGTEIQPRGGAPTSCTLRSSDDEIEAAVVVNASPAPHAQQQQEATPSTMSAHNTYGSIVIPPALGSVSITQAPASQTFRPFRPVIDQSTASSAEARQSQSGTVTYLTSGTASAPQSAPFEPAYVPTFAPSLAPVYHPTNFGSQYAPSVPIMQPAFYPQGPQTAFVAHTPPVPMPFARHAMPLQLPPNSSPNLMRPATDPRQNFNLQAQEELRRRAEEERSRMHHVDMTNAHEEEHHRVQMEQARIEQQRMEQTRIEQARNEQIRLARIEEENYIERVRVEEEEKRHLHFQQLERDVREEAATAQRDFEQRRHQQEETRMRQEQEARLRHEEGMRIRHEQELQLRQEQEARMQHEQQQRARQEQEFRTRQELERRAREDHMHKQMNEHRLRMEQETQMRIQEERARQEQEQRARQEQEQRARQEHEQRARQEHEQRMLFVAQEQNRQEVQRISEVQSRGIASGESLQLPPMVAGHLQGTRKEYMGASVFDDKRNLYLSEARPHNIQESCIDNQRSIIDANPVAAEILSRSTGQMRFDAPRVLPVSMRPNPLAPSDSHAWQASKPAPSESTSHMLRSMVSLDSRTVDRTQPSQEQAHCSMQNAAPVLMTRSARSVEAIPSQATSVNIGTCREQELRSAEDQHRIEESFKALHQQQSKPHMTPLTETVNVPVPKYVERVEETSVNEVTRTYRPSAQWADVHPRAGSDTLRHPMSEAGRHVHQETGRHTIPPVDRPSMPVFTNQAACGVSPNAPVTYTRPSGPPVSVTTALNVHYSPVPLSTGTYNVVDRTQTVTATDTAPAASTAPAAGNLFGTSPQVEAEKKDGATEVKAKAHKRRRSAIQTHNSPWSWMCFWPRADNAEKARAKSGRRLRVVSFDTEDSHLSYETAEDIRSDLKRAPKRRSTNPLCCSETI